MKRSTAILPACAAAEGASDLRVRVGLGAQVRPEFLGADETNVVPLFHVNFARGTKPFSFGAPDDSPGIAPETVSRGAFDFRLQRLGVPPEVQAVFVRAALAGEIFPTSKPDVDNVIKGIFDAMNEIVWRDDKQVVDLTVKKRYAETPMARVMVREL